MIPLVILAGGLATRLRPITKNIPKCLVKINQVPFIEYQIKFFLEKGVTDFFILTGYKSNLIESYFKQKKFKAKIKCIKDGKKLLGTGGCIKKTLKLLPSTFAVTFGDTLLDFNFKKCQDFQKKKQKSLITIFKNNNKFDESEILLKKKKIFFVGKKARLKQNYISYGFFIFRKIDFKSFNFKIFDINDLVKSLNQKNNLIFYKAEKRFYEIGTKNSLKEFKKKLRVS